MNGFGGLLGGKTSQTYVRSLFSGSNFWGWGRKFSIVDIQIMKLHLAVREILCHNDIETILG